MAVYLLLDTNILRRLASKTEPSVLLQHLDVLVKNEHVILLSPETLKKEWKKHREKQKEEITRSLKKTQKEAKSREWGATEKEEFTDEQLKEREALLHRQLDVIDDLLFHRGEDITITEAVALLVIRQREAGKAPFHKKDSYDDALIAFSAMDFLQKINEKELYFVTDNDTDFALKQNKELVLHTDIQQLFPNLQTHYFPHIKDCFDAFVRIGLPLYNDTRQSVPNRINNTVRIDRKKSSLNQLYEYITKRSEQASFLPKEILTEHYPIITADTFTFHHRPFTLHTDNREIYDLLSRAKVNEGEVSLSEPEFPLSDEDKKKLMEIIIFLRFNFLENIAFEDGDATPINYSCKSKDCDCPACTFKRLNFSELISSVNSITGSPQENGNENIKKAFGLYKLGNFTGAAKILLDVHNHWRGAKNFQYYIVCFNLANLATIIRQTYLSNKDATEISQELSKIDLSKIYNECFNPSYQPLLEWLHEKKFYQDNFYGLHETLKSITDHFYGQNTGFNEHTRRLIEHYFAVERFMTANAVMYDVFSEFSSLTNLFTEGLFASYGCNPFMSGKLMYFSDSLLEKLLIYGKADDLTKFYHRYKLDNIKYVKSEEGHTILNLIRTLVLTYPDVADNYEENAIYVQEYFWDNYTELIFNAVIILGMIDLEEAAVNEIAEALCDLLERKNHLQCFHLSKHLKFFLIQKRETISPNVLKRYFVLGLNDDYLISDNYTDTLKLLLDKRNLKIDLSEKEFAKFQKTFLTLGEDIRTQSWYTLGNVFSVIDSQQQRAAIRKFVNEMLERSFAAQNFYVAAMFDIIEPKAEYVASYIEKIEQIILKGQQPYFFDKKSHHRDSRVDNFFNFLFKYQLEIPGKISAIISLKGAYYTWLNDPENFDYSNFNPEWLNNHFSMYFKRYFRKSKHLKDFLLQSFKEVPNEDLEHKFLLIYCYDD